MQRINNPRSPAIVPRQDKASPAKTATSASNPLTQRRTDAKKSVPERMISHIKSLFSPRVNSPNSNKSPAIPSMPMGVEVSGKHLQATEPYVFEEGIINRQTYNDIYDGNTRGDPRKNVIAKLTLNGIPEDTIAFALSIWADPGRALNAKQNGQYFATAVDEGVSLIRDYSAKSIAATATI